MKTKVKRLSIGVSTAGRGSSKQPTMPQKRGVLVYLILIIGTLLFLSLLIFTQHSWKDHLLLHPRATYNNQISSVGKELSLSRPASSSASDKSVSLNSTQLLNYSPPSHKNTNHNTHIDSKIKSNSNSNSDIEGTSKIKPLEKAKKVNKKQPKAYDIDPLPGSEGKYIELYSWFPGSKTGVRRDRIVNLSTIPLIPHGLALPPLANVDSTSPHIVGLTRAYAQSEQVLKSHPFTYIYTDRHQSLVDVASKLVAQPQCKDIPIFTTMATVGEDLYWQLIENFMYSMVRFNVSDCSFIICVSDTNCMNLCDKYHFPCYDYRYSKQPMPSIMEQIAIIKLVEIPLVLKKGASIFLLDLDVGFLESPMVMIQAFIESPKIDIFVQEDLIFIMNRTKVGWKTWSTQPLANIGLFLVRGNERTVKVFDMAWEKYQEMEAIDRKVNPGTDQNHVLDGMRYGRFYNDLKYAYFTNRTAMLMDKVFKFDTTLLELGGEASSRYLSHHRTIAMHTTCYEHVTKVMGLKATNAFWHPRYYDPLRPTITKQLIFINKAQLQDELRALVYLAIRTGRAVIVPNILGSDKIPDDTIERFNDQRLWPGFRVLYFEKEKNKSKRRSSSSSVTVDILEPGFYWRLTRDYEQPPEPDVLAFDPNESIASVQKKLERLDVVSHPRVVLHASASSHTRLSAVELGEINAKWGGRESPDKASLSRSLTAVGSGDSEERAKRWAEDSVGLFERSFADELGDYGILPSAQTLIHNMDPNVKSAYDFVFNSMRTCKGILSPLKGNRTCFQICE